MSVDNVTLHEMLLLAIDKGYEDWEDCTEPECPGPVPHIKQQVTWLLDHMDELVAEANAREAADKRLSSWKGYDL